MLARLPLILVAWLLPMACSSGTRQDDAVPDAAQRSRDGGDGGNRDDDALIVPEDVTVTALEGGNGVLDVIALTLRAAANGPELYVALRNDGDVPACHAAVSVELFDSNEQSLAAGIGGLLTQHFYRLTDGSGTIAACVAPGDVAMASVTDLPSDIAIEDVGHVIYRCPYFALDVVPIAGLTIGHVERTTASGGAAYTGMLVNGLDVAVRDPSVSVYPVNRVGRPLGLATASGKVDIAPGGSWAFETSPVSSPGVDHLAYPAGALEAPAQQP